MRPTTYWRLVPGVALALFAAGSSIALTLGRTQGAVQVGRPLDITIPAGLDGSSAAELCAAAEVLYGDTRVEPVQVDVRPGANADTALVRVRIAQPVDEAFVSVSLQVGCTSRLTRRYVLLTEAPGEAAQAAAQPAPLPQAVDTRPALAAPQAPVTSGTTPGSAVAQPLPPAALPPAALATPPRTIAPDAAPRPITRAPTPPRREASAPRPPRTAAAAPAPAPAPRSRLRLDAPEVRLAPAAPALAAPAARGASAPVPAASAARAPSAPAVPAAPVASAAPAAAAASAAAPVAATGASGAATGPAGADGGAAGTVSPEARVLSLEADLKAMRDTVASNNAALAEMRARLEQAERGRGPGDLVWLLGALLAAALALAAYFWSKSRRASTDRWYASESTATPTASGEPILRVDDDVAEPAVRAGGAAGSRAGVAAAAAGAGAVAGSVAARSAGPDSTLSPDRTIATRPAGQPLAGARTAKASAATPHGPDSVGSGMGGSVAEEIGDVQQQADFFVSLGEHERAIETLRAHIDAHPEASAVAWLGLLDIYHRLGRAEDYEQARSDFEWLFDAKVPAYAEYGEGAGGGLESHPDKLARITAAWGTPEALRLIDDAVLQRPGASSADALGLESYRDLLLLRAVATDIEGGEGAAAGRPPEPVADPGGGEHGAGAGAGGGVLAGAAGGAGAAGASGSAMEAAPLDFELPGHPADASDSALDIDLDALGHEPPPAAPLVEDDELFAQLSVPPDFDAPAAGPKPSATPPAADSNLLDFDFDLNEDFKLPPKKR